MKLDLSTKQNKLNYNINELKRLQGLEFISKDEISAMNYACSILRNHVKKLDNTETKIKEKQKYIDNCPVCKECAYCYRVSVCREESK